MKTKAMISRILALGCALALLSPTSGFGAEDSECQPEASMEYEGEATTLRVDVSLPCTASVQITASVERSTPTEGSQTSSATFCDPEPEECSVSASADHPPIEALVRYTGSWNFQASWPDGALRVGAGIIRMDCQIATPVASACMAIVA